MGYELTIRAYFPDGDEGKLESLIVDLTNASKRSSLPKQGLVVLETKIGDGQAAQQQAESLALFGPDKTTQQKAKRHLELATEASKKLPSFTKQRLKSRYVLGSKRLTTAEYGVWEKPLMIDGVEAGVVTYLERQHQRPNGNSWTSRSYVIASAAGDYRRSSHGTVSALVEPLVEMSLTGKRRGVSNALTKKLQDEFEQLKAAAK